MTYVRSVLCIVYSLTFTLFLFFIHIYNSRQKYRISCKSNKEHCLPRGLFTPYYRTPVRNAFTVVRHRGCSCRVGMLIVCRARSSLWLQVLLFVWSFRHFSTRFAFKKYIYFHTIFSFRLYSLSVKDMQIFQANFQF